MDYAEFGRLYNSLSNARTGKCSVCGDRAIGGYGASALGGCDVAWCKIHEIQLRPRDPSDADMLKLLQGKKA